MSSEAVANIGLITPHFSLDELTFSEIAIRKNLDNTPDAETVANLRELALALESVRELLGHPIHVNSGYRSRKVNAALGGAYSSAHCLGYAADFVCPEFGTPKEIARAIMGSDIPFDQCIFEGAWTHFSIDPRMRDQVLTAHFDGGRATYTVGVS